MFGTGRQAHQSCAGARRRLGCHARSAGKPARATHHQNMSEIAFVSSATPRPQQAGPPGPIDAPRGGDLTPVYLCGNLQGIEVYLTAMIRCRPGEHPLFKSDKADAVCRFYGGSQNLSGVRMKP